MNFKIVKHSTSVETDMFGYETGKECGEYEVVYEVPCVKYYPSDGKHTIYNVGGIEGTRHYFVVWLSFCDNAEICDLDIMEGYYAFFDCKYWKIVGLTPYQLCGCYKVKMVLERISPRDCPKPLKVCCEEEDGEENGRGN